MLRHAVSRLRATAVPLGAAASLTALYYGADLDSARADAAPCAATTCQKAIERKKLMAKTDGEELDMDVVGGAVYGALINRKVNACPMAIRVAWHASGTWDGESETGGAGVGDLGGGDDGASMTQVPSIQVISTPWKA